MPNAWNRQLDYVVWNDEIADKTPRPWRVIVGKGKTLRVLVISRYKIPTASPFFDSAWAAMDRTTARWARDYWNRQKPPRGMKARVVSAEELVRLRRKR